MANTAAIDDTIERYYRAWTDHDHDLYGTVWADGATFADPPQDGVVPPTGFDEIAAGMDDVWSRANSIVYDRHTMWHCESTVAVHLTVTMTTKGGANNEGAHLEVPLIHVFRFDPDGLVNRLEAFLDLTLTRVISGPRPQWLDAG
ncbi:MAG: nuclear transport factor 2 family protein [Actinomycetota bacterium]|jgi:hypothetical protein|nr:nuclear transport factor 2 family protein [Actinomycetota bacterium]